MSNTYNLENQEEKTGNLYVNCCGYLRTEPSHKVGPSMKPYYMIYYVLGGKGNFVAGGKNHSLKAEHGFVIMPEEMASCESDKEDPLTYVWVGFDGNLADSVVRGMGLSSHNPMFKSEESKELEQVVKDMMKHNTYGVASHLRRNGQLSIFLSIIADNHNTMDKEKEGNTNHYVRKAIEFIQRNYCNPIKVSEVADYVCINRSYLFTLFKNEIGISPQQFLTKVRIAKATELLQTTKYSIESIALSCGYVDPLVFTKAFKQIEGTSPFAYRKQINN